MKVNSDLFFTAAGFLTGTLERNTIGFALASGPI